MSNHSVALLDDKATEQTIDALAQRLNGLIDLQLTLKHIHWNVVGPNFIAVHEMLDVHVESVRAMTDAVAERIAVLGGTPIGTPGKVVADRSWDDYPLGRANVTEHLQALDTVYDGIIADHRRSVETTGNADPVTEDLLIGQLADLELYQWFVRSHIENEGSS